MNLKALINAILIIFLLHLLIRNIHYKKLFSWNHESFSQSNNLNDNHKETINFLLNTQSNNENINEELTTDNAFNDLNNYVSKCSDVKNQVQAGNYYVTDENNPNFTSNVLNIHKFYDRNLDSDSEKINYDGLTNSELIEKKYNPETIENVKDQQCYPPRNLHNNTELYQVDKPDNWNYKNELPMNGGSVVGNVVGYDTLNEGFSIYNENVEDINAKCADNVDCDRASDDIRFGLGYPNAEYRETN